ncbi:hypothetical protein [Candidatus Sneabacter namystus]|uniref:Uncharacterized protein n=1 Tax=Candidatus Sneabacter namystus TaxID=2601646 RepID=A0A5C0ULF9_9RICK|nr:hypothetical protein [Candidatus Sneabacter namystus]QEK39714.1 hypothetical protein FZC37_02100 [Candidatus Sneabacter namystus]
MTLTKHKVLEYKVCSFLYSELEILEKVRDGGWYITYMTPFKDCCTVILERSKEAHEEEDSDSLYIPPRKKLRITGG